MKGYNTDIVILCGGKGTRIAGSLPVGTPKCMAQIDDVRFISILLADVMRQFPGNKIILATGHLSEIVEEYVRSNPRLEVVEDKSLNGTAECAYWLTMRSARANTMFINGDTWQELDLPEIARFHRSGFYTPMTAAVTYGGGEINRGIFVLTQQYIAPYKALFAGRNLDEYFRMDVQRQVGPVKLFFSAAPFYDIGTPKGLEDFRDFWKNRVSLRSSRVRPIGSASSAAGRTIPHTS